MRKAIQSLRQILIWSIVVFLISSCTTQENAKVKAWIDTPRDGASYNVNAPVNIMSHVYAKDGASEVMLYINGEAYRREAIPADSEEMTSITQEWVPVAPGDMLIQVVALDKNGEKSLPASVLINVKDTNTISATPLITLTEPIATTVTPIITISPSITTTITPTPTMTPTRYISPTHTEKAPDTQFPPAPVQTSPGNGVTLSCRSTQKLVWEPVYDESGIEAYYVKMELLTGTGEWQAAAGYGPTTDTQVSANVQCGIIYRWMVTAKDGAGNSGHWSELHTFIIALE
ncbi:MAG: hypothetical protein JEZ00_13515 [Anaerolineaceae bacterium]|nr:hypothetical protein [Anaerolineaceae bacterium]